MTDPGRRARPLALGERDLIGTALGLQSFGGSDELVAQVIHAVVTGGSPLQMDLAVAAEISPSSFESGPIPTRAVVVDNRGHPVGEIIVWVAAGYLSGLEYAWFADEMPDSLPEPSQLAISS